MNNNLWSYEISLSWDFIGVYNSAKKILNNYFEEYQFKAKVNDLTDFQSIKVSCIKDNLANQQVRYFFATGICRVTLCLEVVCVFGLTGNINYIYDCVIQDDTFTESCGQHTIPMEKLEKLGIYVIEGGDK